MPKYCYLEDCEQSVDARGLCSRHYYRLRQYGDPCGGGRYRRSGTSEQRFWPEVDTGGGPDGCWLWNGNIDSTTGYGRFGVDGGMVYAHRFSYKLAVGTDVPAGIQIDHICHERRCVNPAHLRVATNKQNAENRRDSTRGVTRIKSGKWQAQVTHNYVFYYVGRFDTVEEATEAARLKRCELFTHNDKDRQTNATTIMPERT